MIKNYACEGIIPIRILTFILYRVTTNDLLDFIFILCACYETWSNQTEGSKKKNSQRFHLPLCALRYAIHVYRFFIYLFTYFNALAYDSRH